MIKVISTLYISKCKKSEICFYFQSNLKNHTLSKNFLKIIFQPVLLLVTSWKKSEKIQCINLLQKISLYAALILSKNQSFEEVTCTSFSENLKIFIFGSFWPKDFRTKFFPQKSSKLILNHSATVTLCKKSGKFWVSVFYNT